jgi:L-erythro-3,5-diaminohexanoate dehydrogenase
MKDGSWGELAEMLGADRVLEPGGSLPQPAERLDPSAPVRPFELELAVERVWLDSTSFRDLRERGGGDPEAIGRLIAEIVAARGKLHNPATDSGGILVGTVSAVGEGFPDPPAAGERVVTLGSLTMTPLRLDEVVAVDPASPQVEVTGTAYVFARAAWARLPEDLPLDVAVEIYDVCAAASQIRELAAGAGTVCVLGAGHAGKLAMAAIRDVAAGAQIVAVDVDSEAIAAAAALCDAGVVADLRDPLAAAEAVGAAGVAPADLTVVVVNASGCEPTALLLTAAGGTVLFFSMATRFSAAALAADGIGTDARMLIGSGYSPDRGAYALDLVRRSAPLREALGILAEEPA